MGGSVTLLSDTEQLMIFQAHHGQLPSPHAAGVEGMNVGIAGLALQCRPVTEQDSSPGSQLFKLEPWPEAVWRGRQTFFHLQVELTLSSAEAHSGQVVGDDAQTVVTDQGILPLSRAITIHLVQENL